MTDTPKIEPAVTSEQWARHSDTFRRVWMIEAVDEQDFAALIALANAALKDDDPRKITREKVRLVRELADLAWLRAKSFKIAEPFATQNADRARAEVEQFADALESYLPPLPADDA